MSYDTLKKKISDKLQLQANQIVSCLTLRFLVSGDQYTGVEIADDDDIELMISALQQQPRMRVLELYVEINSVGSSLLPIRSLDINIQPFSSNDDRFGSSSEAAPIHRLNTSREDNDDAWNMDSNEDGEDDGEGQIPDGNSSNTDMEDDFDVDLVPHDSPTTLNIASPVASFGLVSERTHQVEGQTHTPFWNESPHYTYINWDHPDQERDIPDGDVEGSWQIGDELFVKQEFEDKQAVQMAIKYHCMKVHQTAFVAESNRNLLYMKCQNYANGCPWRVRAMLPKYGNRWIITRWGGRHTCVNPYRSQDHKQLDSNFICSCILGMMAFYLNTCVS
ncbi:uncharacterized protein LOC133297519 [Gastrolobium bilobum]|uniref:uncharacterized protein LOC133297519 n=1 Tax=Gastrolobium bilobum TaxID=150636 RepID=UPI002AB03006|nr:uncharacterized protein LOC133297519 [Gastrolobium bilobum]